LDAVAFDDIYTVFLDSSWLWPLLLATITIVFLNCVVKKLKTKI